MTTEEAIRIIDPETAVEALTEIEYYGGFNGDKAQTAAVNEACRLAIAALRAQQDSKVVETDQVKNDPLTLEELRQMDGEPVWCKYIEAPDLNCWAIVCDVSEEGFVEGFHANGYFDDYGKTWIAYRHKPKEGTK